MTVLAYIHMRVPMFVYRYEKVSDMYVTMSVHMSVYVHMASMQVQELSQLGDFFWNNTQVKVWQGQVEGLKTTFLEPCNGMFWVGCVYGRNDDANRFNFFCNAALEYLRHHAGGSRCCVNAEHQVFVVLCICCVVKHACCAWCYTDVAHACYACLLCMLVVHGAVLGVVHGVMHVWCARLLCMLVVHVA